MGERGAIASWVSWITHVHLKQVHDQVNYDAFGVMKHIFHCQKPGCHPYDLFRDAMNC